VSLGRRWLDPLMLHRKRGYRMCRHRRHRQHPGL